MTFVQVCVVFLVRVQCAMVYFVRRRRRASASRGVLSVVCECAECGAVRVTFVNGVRCAVVEMSCVRLREWKE